MEVETCRSNLLKCNYWNKKGNIYYLHREDGPACIMDDGREEWYYHSKEYFNPKEMPLNLFIAYCRWEYRKIYGS